MFIDEKKIIEGNESEDVAHLAHVEDRVSEAILADILTVTVLQFLICPSPKTIPLLQDFSALQTVHPFVIWRSSVLML